MVNKFGLNHLILDIWSHSHSLKTKITGLPEANCYNFKANAVRSIEIGWEENRSWHFLSFLWSQSSSFFSALKYSENIPTLIGREVCTEYGIQLILVSAPAWRDLHIANILKNDFAPLRGLPVLHFEKKSTTIYRTRA